MSPAGSFDPFADAFPTNLLPEVFGLVLKEWPNSPRPEGNPLENRITNRFVGHLENVIRKRAKDRADQFFNLDGAGKMPVVEEDVQDVRATENIFAQIEQPTCREAKESLPPFKFLCRPKLADADSDTESGEVDIRIESFSRHPDAYFVFECKRLNVQHDSRFESNASKYVGNGGMGCFISGQYPTTCDSGGMLGYVMDGNVPTAITAINKALCGHKAQLRLRPPHELEPSTIMADDGVYQTTHNKNRHPLVIYHLLLSFFIPPQAASS